MTDDKWLELPEPAPHGCDCCDPTSDSPDPVVVRLERENEELRAEVERLTAHAEFHRSESDRWMQLYHIRGETIEKFGNVVLERDEARRIAIMLWRDDIAYSASKVLEAALWLEDEE